MNGMDRDMRKMARDLVLVFGAIMTSTGLVAYLPDLQAHWLVLGGLAISHGATRMK